MKAHEALSNAPRMNQKLTARDTSEQSKNSGRLVVHTAAWLARLTGFLHNDLRRGCGVEMYMIDLKGRGQSEAEK
jgi:hypothetical protein